MDKNTPALHELRKSDDKVLISGAAGNLGQALSRHLLQYSFPLKLMVHRRRPPQDISSHPVVEICQADLGDPETLTPACQGVECIVHFAGKLFAPNPERFLPDTNVTYVRNLVTAAKSSGVKKFILVSFPHVEGESNPDHPARGHLAGSPQSIHARTRLLAEQYLFTVCEGAQMIPVSLRSGLIYAKGVLMVDAAHWLMERRLLGVWKKPTWMHLISLPDFLLVTQAAIVGSHVRGIYNVGDDRPLTLQEFLDRIADHWGVARAWHAPIWAFYLAAFCVEGFASIFKTPAPLTRDFIRIGTASYVMDTTRMKAELLPQLRYPALEDGIEIL